MKIGGMGEEALRVRLEDIRLLSELPADVEVVRVLPPAPLGGKPYGPEWVAGDRPFPELFLHIKHRYCVRAPAGSPLMYDYLQNFLRRYAEIKADEGSKRGQRVPDDPMGVYQNWVDDDA
jgi:hypothetical protein